VEYKFLSGRWSPYLTAGAGIYWNITQHWFFKGAFRVWGTSVNGISVVYGPTLSAGYSF
jgi:hypothetical protein